MATQREVGEHLTISERQVAKLLRRGVLPPTKGVGAYNLDLCRAAYIDYLRGVSTGQVDDIERDFDSEPVPEIDLNEERAKNLQVDTRLKELKELQIKRETAPIFEIQHAMAKTGEQISAILGQIPTKIRRRLPDLTASDIEIIKREVAKAQNIASKSGGGFGADD